MSSVDNRIVEMQFDNKQFEKGISTTINSIDDLKKALNFTGAEKGIDNITSKFNGIGLDKVNTALDSVTSKFSIFGTVADQAIRRVTDSITGTLLTEVGKLANAFSGREGLLEGFKEYELKVKSIQTIAANTGALSNKTVQDLSEDEEQAAKDVIQGLYASGEARRQQLELAGYNYDRVQSRVNELMDNMSENGKKTTSTMKDIDEALDELNNYADKTIYNFAQMTDAIGKFTVSGIDLATSTEAVKGIANLAAVSGAQNEQYNRALYNISQAMSTGKIQLVDWKSLELAGMGGEMFQKAIVETAKKSTDAATREIAASIESGKVALRDTLNEGWLTNDVLIESLNKFTAFTEEMTDEERELERVRWEKMGYTREEIANIEELSRISYEAAQKVRTWTQLVDTLKEEIGSSYTSMWQNIIGDFNEATELWTGIHDVIEDNFVKPMAEARDVKWSYFHDNGGRDAAIQGFANVGNSLLKLFHAISDAWHEVFPRDDGRRITAIAKAFAAFSEKLVMSDETAEKVKTAFKGLFSILHIGTTIISEVIKLFAKLISVIFSLGSGTNPILDLMAAIGELFISLDKFITEGNLIEEVLNTIVDLIKKIPPALDPLEEGFGKVFNKMKNGFGEARDIVKGFVKGSEDDINSMQDADTSGAEKFSNKVKDSLSPIADFGSVFFEKVKHIASVIWEWVKEAAVKVAELYKNTTAEDISLAAIIQAIIGVELFGMFKNLTRSIGQSANDISKITKNLDKITNSIVGILSGVKDVLHAYVMDIKANVILKIAGAVLMLCGALIALSQIDTVDLWNAVGAMSALMLELGALSHLLSDDSDKLITGTFTDMGKVILEMTTGIWLLASSLLKLSKLNSEQLAQGTLGITIVLNAIVISLKLLSKEDSSKIKGAGLVIMSIALAIDMLIPAILSLGALNEVATKGIISVMWVLIELVSTVSALALEFKYLDSKGLAIAGATMMEIATAIDLLIPSLIILSLIPDDKIAKATGIIAALMIAMASSIFLMSIAMKKLLPSDVLALGLALNEMAIAINLLVIPLTIIGALPFKVIAQGVTAVAITISALVIALKYIPDNSAKLAAGMIEMAVAVDLIATALAILAIMKTEQIIKAAISIGVVIAVMTASLYKLDKIGNIKRTAKSFVMMSSSIAIIAASLYALAKIDTNKIWGAAGALIGIMVAIVGLGYMLGEFKIDDNLMKLNLSFLAFGGGLALAAASVKLIVDALKEISEMDFSGANFENFGEVLSDIFRGIKESADEAVEAVLAIVGSIIAGLIAAVPSITKDVIKLMVKILIDIRNNIHDIVDNVYKIFIKVLEGIADNIYDIVTQLIRLIYGIVTAVNDRMDTIVAAAFGLVLSTVEGITKWLKNGDNRDRLLTDLEALIYEIGTLIIDCGWIMIKVGWRLLTYLLIGLTDLGYALGEKLYDFMRGADGNGGLVAEIRKVVDSAADAFKDIGKSIVDYIVDGIINGLKITTGNKYIDAALSEMLNASIDTFIPGRKIYRTINNGFSAIRSVWDENSPSKEGEKTGGWLVDGIVKGIAKKENEANNAMGGLAKGMLSTLNFDLGVASPSKLTEQTGIFVIQGLINGLEESRKVLSSSINDICNSIDEDFNNTENKPKITPVLNMDEFEYGSAFSDIRTDVNGLVTNRLSVQFPSLDENNDKVVNAIGLLQEEISELQDYISELTIQMDTGALVGSIVKPMDKALGGRVNMRKQGV